MKFTQKIENQIQSFLKNPLIVNRKYLDKLVEKGDSIELNLSYSKNPLRQAYQLHSVSAAQSYHRGLKQYLRQAQLIPTTY